MTASQRSCFPLTAGGSALKAPIDAAKEQVKRIEDQMLMLLKTWKRRSLVEGGGWKSPRI